MDRLKTLSSRDIAIEMTDFVVNMINSMHLFKDNEMFVERNIARHAAQICIKYDKPTHVELRTILKIELHNSDLSFDLCSLESLNLSKEQELEALRGLNCIAEALKKELNYVTQGTLTGPVSLNTELGQILEEAEDEQKRLLARKGSRR